MAIKGRRFPLRGITILKNQVSSAPVAARPVVASFAATRFNPRLSAFRPIRPITIKTKVVVLQRAFIARPPNVVSFATTRFNPKETAFLPLRSVTIRTRYKFIFPTTMNRRELKLFFAATIYSPRFVPFSPIYHPTIKPGPKPPAPVPPPFIRGHNKTLIQRDPTQLQPLRRFTEILADMINSLVGQGQIVQLGPADWTIANGAFIVNRAPTVNDDNTIGVQPGAIWIDTLTHTIYINESNSTGAAVWLLASGTGQPAGSNTQVQFNDAGAFGGSPGFLFGKTTQHAAIGPNSAIDDGSLLYPGTTYSNILSLQQSFIDLSATNVEGFTDYIELNPSTDVGSSSFVANVDAEIVVKAGNTKNNAGIIVNYYGLIDNFGSGNYDILQAMFFQVQTHSSGTTFEMTGIGAQVINFGSGAVFEMAGSFIQMANSGLGAVTNMYGYFVTAPLNDGGGTVTNNYGIFIEDQTGVGSTDCYNFYSLGPTAKHYFAGMIGVGVLVPNASASVQIDSTTQGFLPPRMTTTQKNAISSPAEGLIVYDTTLHKLCVRTAGAWETITSV